MIGKNENVYVGVLSKNEEGIQMKRTVMEIVLCGVAVGLVIWGIRLGCELLVTYFH